MYQVGGCLLIGKYIQKIPRIEGCVLALCSKLAARGVQLEKRVYVQNTKSMRSKCSLVQDGMKNS